MSEQLSNEQMAQLAAMLASQQKPSGGWNAPGAAPTPQAVLVPVEVETPMGKIRAYLQYGPEHSSPEAIMQLLQSLANAGVPLAAWKSNQGGWGGGNQGGNGGGGWNGGNRGGYGRRY